MATKLNGYAPPLATIVAIAVLVISVAVSWGSNDNRLDEHDRRLGVIELLVGDMREDVAAIRAVVAPQKQSEPHGG